MRKLARFYPPFTYRREISNRWLRQRHEFKEVQLKAKKGEEEEKIVGVRVSSEPCKPTTSACGRPTHFVRRKRKENIRSAVVPVRFTEAERNSVRSS